MANPWDTHFEQAANQLYSQVQVDQWPEEFVNPDTTFIDAWVQTVQKEFEIKGADPRDPVAGIVLLVESNGQPSLVGTRNRMAEVGQRGPPKPCLRVWVHTQFDEGLSLPTNFLTPDIDDMRTIMMHYVYEADATTKAPSPGDVVKVLHPWAKGFTNKVGEYLSEIAPGMPITLKSTAKAFVKAKESKCGGRKTDVPATLSGELERTGARPTFTGDTGAVGGPTT